MNPLSLLALTALLGSTVAQPSPSSGNIWVTVLPSPTPRPPLRPLCVDANNVVWPCPTAPPLPCVDTPDNICGPVDSNGVIVTPAPSATPIAKPTMPPNCAVYETRGAPTEWRCTAPPDAPNGVACVSNGYYPERGEQPTVWYCTPPSSNWHCIDGGNICSDFVEAAPSATPHPLPTVCETWHGARWCWVAPAEIESRELPGGLSGALNAPKYCAAGKPRSDCWPVPPRSKP